MSGPPEDVSPSELFLKLQEVPLPSEVIPFPRKTRDGKSVGKLRILVLGMKEHNRARQAGLDRARKEFKLSDADMETALGSALLSDAVAREILLVTCVTEKPIAGSENSAKPRYGRIFPTPESLDEAISADEVRVLYASYLLVQNKWGPFEKTIQTDQELSAWIKRLKEGAAELPLRRLSSVHWGDVASLSARRAYTLSVILESLSPSLPPTLKSRLERYSIGTGFFGSPVPSKSPDGSESSQELRRSPGLSLVDEPITLDDARELARMLSEGEAGALRALDEAELDRD